MRHAVPANQMNIQIKQTQVSMARKSHNVEETQNTVLSCCANTYMFQEISYKLEIHLCTMARVYLCSIPEFRKGIKEYNVTDGKTRRCV